MINSAANSKAAFSKLDKAMQRKGGGPSFISYSALISACDKGKQQECALELFEAMQRQGVVPSFITYNALISACEKDKQPECYKIGNFRSKLKGCML